MILLFDAQSLRLVDAPSEGGFGYTREELLTLDAFALFPRWWNAAKVVESVVTLAKPRAGPFVPVRLAFSRTEHGGREVLKAEVMAREPLSELERELEATNAYLHAIVENLPDMIFVKDARTHA